MLASTTWGVSGKQAHLVSCFSTRILQLRVTKHTGVTPQCTVRCFVFLMEISSEVLIRLWWVKPEVLSCFSHFAGTSLGKKISKFQLCVDDCWPLCQCNLRSCSSSTSWFSSQTGRRHLFPLPQFLHRSWLFWRGSVVSMKFNPATKTRGRQSSRTWNVLIVYWYKKKKKNDQMLFFELNCGNGSASSLSLTFDLSHSVAASSMTGRRVQSVTVQPQLHASLILTPLQ